MMGLPDGPKSFKIGLAIYRHNTSVWQTARQTSYDSKDHAMQSVAWIKVSTMLVAGW